MTYGQKVIIGLAAYAAMFLAGFYGAMSAAQPVADEPPALEAVETDDPCLPRLAELLLPACEYAEALVQEADEGDAPPAVFSSLCRNSERLWAVYNELKEVSDDTP